MGSSSSALMELALCCLAAASAAPARTSDCEGLKRLVADVYDFRPSRLSESERSLKAEEMDEVWDLVKADPEALIPCLRAMLEDEKADAWFRFDGSALLVEVDPTPESKKLEIACWSRVDLRDAAPEVYVTTLAKLGVEGFDTTAAAEHWLRSPDASYYLPRHALRVGHREGAVFLWGTIDEAIATPALAKLVRESTGKLQEHALYLLEAQATEESWKAVSSLDAAKLPPAAKESVARFLAKPALSKKGASSFVNRKRILPAFEAFLKGDPEPLLATHVDRGMTEKDWAARVAGVLEEEDLPLLRKVRRKRLTYQSDEALEDFKDYTLILLARTWKPEYTK